MADAVQSRFTVYERPDASPGRCIVCGATQRPVVDFGVDIEWADNGYGKAYFCEHCIKEAASKFPADPSPNVVDRAYHEQALAEQKQIFHDGLRRYLDAFDPSSVPVYGRADSVPEQTEPADTSDNESFVQRYEPKVGRLVIETGDSTVDQDSPGVSGSTGDGKSSIFG